MIEGAFPEPWLGLTPEQASTLESEARREMGRGHELRGLKLRAVAKCGACDDVVFEASDGTWAIVHLTWANSGRFKREKPPWPMTERFGTVLALEMGMADRHA